MAEGYVTKVALDANNEIIGYQFCKLGVFMDMIKKGVDANEALAKCTGTSLIDQASESGIISMLMEVAGILGAMMVGVLIASNIKINIALAPVVNGAEINIQGILDNVMPGLLSLVLWWGSYKALQKGLTPVKLIFIIMGGCILLSLVGIL